MYNIYKYVFTKKPIKNNINTNNINTNNIMETYIIRLGHYKSNNSGTGRTGDAVEIIKILGEDINRPGYWKTNELLQNDLNGNKVFKTISEQELINNWTFIETSIREDVKKLPKNLFAGLEEISEEEEIVYKEPQIIEQKLTTNISEGTTPTIQAPAFYHQVVELSPDEKFIFNILDKLSISKNNLQINKDENVIGLFLELPLDYNFNKLKETINLFNLDIDKVIDFILISPEIKNLIQLKMKDKFFELLSDKHISEIIKEKEIVPELFKELNKEFLNEKIIIPKILNFEKLVVDESLTKITSENDPRILELTKKLSEKYAVK